MPYKCAHGHAACLYFIQACIQCNNAEDDMSPSAANCVTVGTDGPGVSNTDFLLYVSSLSVGTCMNRMNQESPSTIAFASACAMELEFDRYTLRYMYHIKETQVVPSHHLLSVCLPPFSGQ